MRPPPQLAYRNASLRSLAPAAYVETCEAWRLPAIALWSLSEYWRRYREQLGGSYRFPASFVRDCREEVCLGLADAFWISGAALLLTLARLRLTHSLFLPLASWLRAPPRMAARLPESLFKLAFYSASSGLMWCLARGRYEWVWRTPMSIFERWEEELDVRWDVYALYVGEIAFYLHSLYAWFRLDGVRKDAWMMLVHHVATLALLLFSLGIRQHLSGLLVLLCHDPCDIFLELWKLNSSLRQRAGGAYYALHDALATAAFVAFATSWATLRLYYFPFKVLYAVTYGPVSEGLVPRMPFYPIFVSNLYLLQIMNAYWFSLIVVGVWEYARGNMKEIDDVREYDDEDDEDDHRDR